MSTARPPRNLNITHLDEVIGVLKKHHYNETGFEQLGLSLGLLPDTLSSIKADNKTAASCLRECLSKWLYQADSVNCPCYGGPTWPALKRALRKIGENAVADGLHKDKIPQIYDAAKAGDLSNEDHAECIFRRHYEQLRNLSDPANVAILLYEEKDHEGESVIPEATVNKMQNSKFSMDQKSNSLLMNVQEVISKNHRILWIFARVCTYTGNEAVGYAIMADYEATFENIDEPTCEVEELFTKMTTEVNNIVTGAGYNDEHVHTKLASFIERRCCVQLSTSTTSSESMIAIVQSSCTIFSTTPLEELTVELNLPQARSCISRYKDIVKKSQVSSVLDIKPPSLLEMEKLTIAFQGHEDAYIVQRETLLTELFGNLSNAAVKWHRCESNAIICSFNPAFASLLMKLIFEKRNLCKEKGIDQITVGYCPVWDKVYEQLYEEMEKKNNDLTKKLEDVENQLQEVRKKLEESDQEISQLKDQLSVLESKSKEVEELQKENSSLKKDLEIMNETKIIADKINNERESILQKQLQEKDRKIESLKYSLSEQQERLKKRESELKDKERVARALILENEQLRISLQRKTDQPLESEVDQQNSHALENNQIDLANLEALTEQLTESKRQIKYLEEQLSRWRMRGNNQLSFVAGRAYPLSHV